MEIKQADSDVYTDIESIVEELPDHTPRFVLLSYPLTLVCRNSVSDCMNPQTDTSTVTARQTLISAFRHPEDYRSLTY